MNDGFGCWCRRGRLHGVVAYEHSEPEGGLLTRMAVPWKMRRVEWQLASCLSLGAFFRCHVPGLVRRLMTHELRPEYIEIVRGRPSPNVSNRPLMRHDSMGASWAVNDSCLDSIFPHWSTFDMRLKLRANGRARPPIRHQLPSRRLMTLLDLVVVHSSVPPRNRIPNHHPLPNNNLPSRPLVRHVTKHNTVDRLFHNDPYTFGLDGEQKKRQQRAMSLNCDHMSEIRFPYHLPRIIIVIIGIWIRRLIIMMRP